MKSSISFVCQECGYESLQWLGKCPECNTWNSLKEFQVSSKFSGKTGQSLKSGKHRENEIKPKTLGEIAYEEKTRLSTGFSEMDNVLGGGIVQGSVTLLAGDPGIGKSTLLLQTAINVSLRSPSQLDEFSNASVPASRYSAGLGIRPAKRGLVKTSSRGKAPRDTQYANSENFVGSPRPSVLYLSGEESEEQIKLRAKRILGSQKANDNLFLLSITDTDATVSVIEELRPKLVIIDSIQTMESENLEGLAGSVGQVRYAASSFIKTAKTLNIPIILIGHVTKEGMVAGPMILSHMVDTVLFLEGEKTTGTRILRGLKNRFGPIDEVGVFVMDEEGMKEVKNPENFFLNKENKNTPGSVLVVTIEGTRAFLVEIQALVIFSKLPFPRRVALGIDPRRLELLLAVLQKHCRLPLESMDVFINVAGGLKISDPGADLGIALSVFSSLKNVPLTKTVGIAEVGLLGELRSVPLLPKRINQAKKLGFKNIISANTNRYLREVIES